MRRLFALLSLCVSLALLGGRPAPGRAAEEVSPLPAPHYHREAGDPAWMKTAAQLHGHLGPMLMFGARMGMAARAAVDADGYFDLEITCEGPMAATPGSCFLDGLQISTGATLGKRNLHWVDAKQIVVRVKNTQTGETAVLQPRAEFLALLPKPAPQSAAASEAAHDHSTPGDDNDHQYDALSRRIATMPASEILTISRP